MNPHRKFVLAALLLAILASYLRAALQPRDQSGKHTLHFGAGEPEF
jgi:hypothetical protein